MATKKSETRFDPTVLDRTVIARPLLELLDQQGDNALFDVVIDVNINYAGGRERARERVADLIAVALAAGADARVASTGIGVDHRKTDLSDQYVFARLDGRAIRALVRLDSETAGGGGASSSPARVIFHIWPDFEVRALLTHSVSTVKADAAFTAFTASGSRIVWAVLDSGVQGDHPHFRKHKTLLLDAPLAHADFTVPPGAPGAPLVDAFGHGTHVAGIIAGELTLGDVPSGQTISAVARHRDETGAVTREVVPLTAIRGIAPQATIVSLKVLGADGRGPVSNVIIALESIDRVNGYGKDIKIHGVNLSVGYDFDPEWFACGQSPLCNVVDRLVRSGVVVVVAAGNTGYGYADTLDRGSVAAGLSLSINDPGNADRAITVGSTHRDMPHVYGVSYFSSKGPTGDGRPKPDLVAPGEKIISCGAGAALDAARSATQSDALYVEDSGTSMAAPHVSGAIAAFLSIRREYIGQSEEVKRIFMKAATDLNRERYFQGAGLIDLMRAIQSV
ncbi:MAG TPA: S8 family peptidase [Gemmatimonadaceae bacterium]|jgi:subtilisin family serine protease|nr:S8 family peptidase [Gemmatimonadaceae bacterium]